METFTNKQASYAMEIGVLVGYVLLLCVMIAACPAFYVIFILKPMATQNVNVANLPPLTPSPHVLSTFIETAPKLLEEGFNDNQNDWIDASSWGGIGASQEDVRDGKLFFASLPKENPNLSYALTTCKPCTSLNHPYFLTAHVATDRATDQGYGIMFHKGGNPGSFYAFVINAETKNYYLLAADNWLLRTSGESDLIQSYPGSNTLGIYVNEGRLEFYINQQIVDAYEETGSSWETGAIGFYVESPGFTMTVDDLDIYEIGDR